MPWTKVYAVAWVAVGCSGQPLEQMGVALWMGKSRAVWEEWAYQRALQCLQGQVPTSYLLYHAFQSRF